MQTRRFIELNRNWEFMRGKAGRGWLDGAGADGNIVLPHCWNSDDAFREGVEYYRGWGSYRLRFKAPEMAEGCRWRLVSEGFYGTGEVRLNGRRLGKVDGQYLGFEFDVTDVIRSGDDNSLGIGLTNRCHRNVLPGNPMPDFLLYGGLSGRLRLEIVPTLRIDERRVQIESAVEGDCARVTISAEVAGDSGAGGQAVRWRLRGPDGTVAADFREVAVHDGRARCQLTVQNPQLWDVDEPQLHLAEGELLCDGEVVDAVEVTFGIRTAEFRPYEGFFLNGRRLELRGCNRHESRPGFGRALPLTQHRQDAELIRAMGLNFVRLAHYPQHPEFLRACDELGILVYAEIASWKSVRGGGWLKKAERQMRGMVTRDRNHPSVILWGMGNEGRHRRAFLRLYAICKELDPSRPVTYAENHLYRARRKKTLGIPDIWGLNYEFDALREGCEACRLKCVVVSECSNYPHTVPGDADAERTQLETIQRDLARLEKEKFVAGFALWCFNDYATLRKKRYRRFSGLVSADRQPKASAYWLSEKYGGTLVRNTDEDRAD